ncbi:carbamoyltransferase HypF [Thermodesulfobacteriota bacterium]
MDPRDINLIAKGLEIRGIVQGVGFRPFLYRLAGRFNLKGEIANTSSGLFAHIEGNQSDIEDFLTSLKEKSPILAVITDIMIKPESFRDMTKLVITESKSDKQVSALIMPDVSICDDCLRELFDPGNRRYLYPFINCINCGPRYSIIDKIPYDRPNTSMKNFQMCDSCMAEYDDPADRRFHAQPNACLNCGPKVSLHDSSGKKIDTPNPVRQAAVLLNEGCILAVKGLGGFHLVVDAENSKAVIDLRERKHREEKPLALMSYNLQKVNIYAYVNHEEEIILTSLIRPIVLLKKRKHNPISYEVSPVNNYFGVMLPYTPLHYLLLSHGFIALVMTSGNISGEPLIIDNNDAFNRLEGIADYFLIHDRDIYIPVDDSILKKTGEVIQPIRRSRGYVPAPILLKERIPRILACGAELKNTICLTRENKAFLSQHLGDLENMITYELFCRTIEHMRQMLCIEPEIIACDYHPDYLSTRYAFEQNDVPKIQVQHHHAHIAACMAENRLEGEVIGLSFDGTGYGLDGTMWGGEILIAEAEKFLQCATLSKVPMPGGEAAVKEPWRMAISYLYNTFGDEYRNLGIPFINGVDLKKAGILIEMMGKEVNSPVTSSLGRLFDGVASIIGVRNNVFFEGQAAMELEMMAAENIDGFYDYEWSSGDIYRVMLQPVIAGVVEDIKKGVNPHIISAKFHMTIIKMFSHLCEKIRADNGLNRVALSGGAFQNSILLSGFIKSLKEKGFEVYIHRLLPPNDGGISLGQAVVAAHSVSKL